jgi:hypothetical protein
MIPLVRSPKLPQNYTFWAITIYSYQVIDFEPEEDGLFKLPPEVVS